ncbi:(4Fe-4S)-binding protein [Trichococcus palustris]
MNPLPITIQKWEGTTMNESELLAQGYRKYTGENVDVYFNLSVCTHSGNCVRGNHAIFDMKRKPWILPDADSAEEVARVIHTCPSGALKYRLKGQEEILPTFPLGNVKK